MTTTTLEGKLMPRVTARQLFRAARKVEGRAYTLLAAMPPRERLEEIQGIIDDAIEDKLDDDDVSALFARLRKAAQRGALGEWPNGKILCLSLSSMSASIGVDKGQGKRRKTSTSPEASPEVDTSTSPEASPEVGMSTETPTSQTGMPTSYLDVIHTLRAEIDHLYSQVKALREDNKYLAAERDRLFEENYFLTDKSETIKLQEEVRSLREKYASLRVDYDELDADYERLETDYDRIKAGTGNKTTAMKAANRKKA